MNQNRQMAVAPLNTKIETVEALETSTITSRQLAELSGKKHKNILQSIRDMEPAWVNELGQPKFQPTSYIDSWNRPQLEYLLTEETTAKDDKLNAIFEKKRKEEFSKMCVEKLNAIFGRNENGEIVEKTNKG